MLAAVGGGGGGKAESMDILCAFLQFCIFVSCHYSLKSLGILTPRQPVFNQRSGCFFLREPVVMKEQDRWSASFKWNNKSNWHLELAIKTLRSQIK